MYKDNYVETITPQDEELDLYLSDEDIRYIVEHMGTDNYPTLLSHLLAELNKYIISFVIILFVEMFLNMFLLFATYGNNEISLMLMKELFGKIKDKEAELYFLYMLYISTCLGAVFYPLGIFSVYFKNLKLLRIFTTSIIIYLMCNVLLVYINM